MLLSICIRIYSFGGGGNKGGGFGGGSTSFGGGNNAAGGTPSFGGCFAVVLDSCFAILSDKIRCQFGEFHHSGNWKHYIL